MRVSRSKGVGGIFLLMSVFALFAGCAGGGSEMRWLNPALASDDLGARNARDRWAGTVEALPMFSSSRLPGVAAEAEGADPVPTRRIVLRVGGEEAPQLAHFCAGESSADATMNFKPGVSTLSGAICDGPTVVAFARSAECGAGKAGCNVDMQIASVKKALVAAFYPGPAKQLCDSEQPDC